LYIHDSPVLELGGTGSFDEFGVHPGSFIKQDDGTLLFFYQGWTRMESVPYITTLGLATSTNCGVTFSKVSKGPLFSRSLEDPFLENGFFV
ncbi:glycosylase, partial [Klebsiella pneumoniae]